MSRGHEMMPELNHDERAEQYFVRDLKLFLADTIETLEQKKAERIKVELGEAGTLEKVRDRLFEEETTASWLTFRRISQEMVWDAVIKPIDRQIDDLTARGKIENPRGSVRTDPNFVPPRYLTALDIHMTPGGYDTDAGEGDIRQGAIVDSGGALYMLGRNGGAMNDVRGHTVVSHYFDQYPDKTPERILDIGCSVGASTVAVASYFPEAEVHAIDIGGALLRYAHARAEHLEQTIHFSQQNAEQTDFEDQSFDLIYSAAVLHETSNAALPRILAECHRLLKPGGVMIHAEVPNRSSEIGLWGQLRGEIEGIYNNEPFWRGANSADFEALLQDAGFKNIKIGYQDATSKAQRGTSGFSDKSGGTFRSWFVVSAEKE